MSSLQCKKGNLIILIVTLVSSNIKILFLNQSRKILMIYKKAIARDIYIEYIFSLVSPENVFY